MKKTLIVVIVLLSGCTLLTVNRQMQSTIEVDGEYKGLTNGQINYMANTHVDLFDWCWDK